MPAPLSPDLRLRVLRAVEGGLSCRAAAPRFEVRDPTVLRWVRAYRRTGQTQAKPSGGDRRSGRIEAHADFLLRTLEETPDLTRAELQEILRHEPGEPFPFSTLHHGLRRHGITFTKNGVRPRTERGEARRRAASLANRAAEMESSSACVD